MQDNRFDISSQFIEYPQFYCLGFLAGQGNYSGGTPSAFHGVFKDFLFGIVAGTDLEKSAIACPIVSMPLSTILGATGSSFIVAVVILERSYLRSRSDSIHGRNAFQQFSYPVGVS